MHTAEISKIKEQLNHVVSMVDPSFINALSELHRKLAKEHVDWAVGGELGEALRTVQVEPDCIEIVTSKKGAAQIFLAVKDLNPVGLYFQTERLNRNAIVDDKEYPVYLRSYFFDFALEGVQIKVHGDPQYRISNWDWGDKIDFTPEYIYIVGAKTAIVPLQIKLEIYQALGWKDRAEKVMQVIAKRHPPQVTA